MKTIELTIPRNAKDITLHINIEQVKETLPRRIMKAKEAVCRSWQGFTLYSRSNGREERQGVSGKDWEDRDDRCDIESDFNRDFRRIPGEDTGVPIGERAKDDRGDIRRIKA